MRPSFEGYRVLVTEGASGRRFWVNLDQEGAPTFLRDYSGGGGKGAIHWAKRESQELTHPAHVSHLTGGCCGVGSGRGRGAAAAAGRGAWRPLRRAVPGSQRSAAPAALPNSSPSLSFLPPA